MADIWQAQDAFWNSFGIPAYDDQTAEPGIGYPHITYESFSGQINQSTSLSVNLWYRDSSWAAIKNKAEEIRMALKNGKVEKINNGYLWIKMPESAAFARPFASGGDDALIKRILITVECEALSI